MNVIPNGLENYMSFTNNNKLIFIESFQFLTSPLDGLAKNLDLVKQKRVDPYECNSDFEKFK